VAGGWTRLHNEELRNMYSSLNIKRIKSRRMRWAGYVVRMGETRNIHKLVVRISEDKRPFGRPRRRWEDNIKIDLKEIGYGDVGWIYLAQDRDQ
jgi:hypothetical protein